MRTVIRLVEMPDWRTLWRLLYKPKSENTPVEVIDTR
ncbi:hypothetical protein IMCC3135_07855 [Granulosicoccus antarcticus IMCC3135]|uniref:Uncharacterized protein n=1 Tax=Granulosicoccus antarcticus IMCC3135 TaxID=1192854 RepID=A0A2Z2NWY5_9GAMM|nr:hypothetical protein IMCC3135_07855 [Granulosicoccus antarcticus IMCC3135]